MDFWTLVFSALIGVAFTVFATRSALKRDNAGDWANLKRLSEKGVNLESPREVEFHLFVRTEASAKHVAAELSSEGFTVTHEPGHIEFQRRGKPEGERDEGFLIHARKTVVLYGDTLRDLRKRLSPLAEKENGHYLGWRAIDESPLGRSGAGAG